MFFAILEDAFEAWKSDLFQKTHIRLVFLQGGPLLVINGVVKAVRSDIVGLKEENSS